MPVTNLMRDIVVNAVDEVLKKEDSSALAEESRDEIIAYVMNRVPPKYVTSEQGLLHGILESKYKVQQHVDIFFLIYEAIDKISKRRGRGADENGRVQLEKGTSLLPHIIGQVIEESSLTVMPDIEVSLLFRGAPVQMVDSHWANPYTTNAATKGHYHFWPKYSEKSMGNTSPVPFALVFRHPDCVEKTVDIRLDIIPGSGFGKTQFVPLVLMKSTAVRKST